MTPSFSVKGGTSRRRRRQATTTGCLLPVTVKRIPFPGTLLVVAALLLTGCQNRYATNYRPAVAAYSGRLAPPTPAEPQVISTTRLNDEMQTFQGSGYTVIGSSSF